MRKKKVKLSFAFELGAWPAGAAGLRFSGVGSAMAEFRYQYRKRSTGRINNGNRSARNEAQLRAELANDSEVEEILSVQCLPPEPATEPQLEYLADLIGHRPSGITKREASDMIDNAKAKREPGTELDRQIAAKFDVDFTRYTSKANISYRITSTLLDRAEAEPLPLAQWFVYRVYRDAMDRRKQSGIDNPLDARVSEIARELIDDPAALLSLKRAAKHPARGFRWFGEIEGRDGSTLVGESTRTKAYRFAADALERRGLYGRRAGTAAERWVRSTAFVRSSEPDSESTTPASKFLTRLIYLAVTIVVAVWLFS